MKVSFNYEDLGIYLTVENQIKDEDGKPAVWLDMPDAIKLVKGLMDAIQARHDEEKKWITK